MAAAINPCCTVWKEKCSKLEAGRKHLRQAVQILNEQIDKIQEENVSLKRAYEQEQEWAKDEKEGKERELATRASLENEISVLKSEISSLKQEGSADVEDKGGEVKLLQDRVSKAEKEITLLKTLLEKEKIRADFEMKNAETQKKSATEAWKCVKAEKAKACEERKHANVEEKKVEEYRVKLVALRKEVDVLKSKLASETLKIEEASKKLDAERHKVTKEKKRADSEMAKVEEQRNLAEANGKKAMEEKSRAENLSQELADARRRIVELCREINNFMSYRNLEKASCYQHNQNGISALNSEISSQQTGSIDVEHETREVACVQNQFSGGEEEISQLRELLQKDKQRSDSLEKNAQAEEKIAAEAWKCAIAEKAIADDERKNANTERKKAEGYWIQLEALRKKADKTNKKLAYKILKFEDANKRLEIGKNQFTKERCVASAFITGKDVKTETRKLKCIKKQLKLEKMRMKYAKKVMKLEMNRSRILQQELGHIKQHAAQLSEHLDALNKWFSSGIDLIEDLEQAGLSTNPRRPKLNRKFCDLESFQLYSQDECQLLRPTCMPMAASYPLSQTALLFPICGGTCYKSLSGIDSKLKSLHEDSCLKLLPSSAINSSLASFPDAQLVGSQATSTLVSTSEKWVEDGQTSTSGIPGEMTKVQCSENFAVAAENSVGSNLRFDAFGRVTGHGRNWKRMLDTIESVEFLHSEGKKLHVQMEDKFSVLYGMLNREIEKPIKESKYAEASVQEGSYAKHEKVHKKRKVPCDQRIMIKQLSGIDEQEKNAQIGNEVHNDANACIHASPFATSQLGIPQECLKGSSDSFGTDLELVAIDDAVEDGDYMKLLDLDNTVDEECYRRAIEMPLSPTFHEVKISMAEIFDMDRSKVGDSFHGGLSSEKAIKVPSHSFDVIDVEISSNNFICNALKTSCNEFVHEKSGMVNSSHMPGNVNWCCNATETERAYDKEIRDYGVVKVSNVASSSDEGLKISNFLFESKLESLHNYVPQYCVVFSGTKDSSSISRIFCATRTGLVRCALDAKTECMVQQILNIIKVEDKLSSKEKACAFFTLLLLNFSAYTYQKPGSFSDKDFVLCLDSFAGQVNAVVSDVEPITGLCCLDDLFAIIEDFLMNGQVMVHTDLSSETSIECHSRMDIFLGGIHINLSSMPASTDQLVAGSIIFASLCAAVDHIGFICEASYNLLRTKKYHTDVSLTILHVFAYLGGNRFFSLTEYNLMMAVLKSIITFLEGENSSGALAPSRLSSYGIGFKFHPCAQCPFDAVSVDVVVSVLLEKLHSCVLSVTMHQNLMELANLSNSHALCHRDNAKSNLHHEEACSVLADASCSLNNCVMPVTHSYTVHNETLCYLSDVLSLMELLACYMSWEWTCDKFIPVLLEIMERPMLDDFAVAVVILLGQLGRQGVAANGHKDKDVEDLKHKLSCFLQPDAATRASLSVQIAAVTSLLGILSLDFEDVMKSELKLPEIESQSVFTDPIRNWFSLLGKGQQALSYSLLQSAGVVIR